MTVLKPHEAAQAIGISLSTLRRHIAEGNMAVIIVGTGAVAPRYRIEREEVERFKRDNQRRFMPQRSQKSCTLKREGKVSASIILSADADARRQLGV